MEGGGGGGKPPVWFVFFPCSDLEKKLWEVEATAIVRPPSAPPAFTAQSLLQPVNPAQ